ncbi:DUF1836 domain-containing protein [Paenibacillus mesophilus]|uniref:DUF1836 domain-containing protein n=1 Tax=Paenibacillus mesophilus TaxID=2582849 RepID=UPI00110DF2E1|nr:DUF1836 domain-containing protein [Paenibacillus mesophilus]TMV52865.1 DUF1836 domain-containing protein [Paenibacillus mesophilus]
MESFNVTRKEMASLLVALDGRSSRTPLQVLQESWRKTHRDFPETSRALPVLLSTELPPVMERVIRGGEVRGFSLQEIADLGKHIEYSHLSITAIQNWVKRDFKAYFDSPKMGRKYSLNQAALIYIIDDLKSNLDFVSIQKLFKIVFLEEGNEKDDLISPIDLYMTYSSMFEELDANNDQLMDTAGHVKENRNQDALTENAIRTVAERYAGLLPHISGKQKEAIQSILFIAAISIQTSYFHSLARRYLNAILFLET